jgi:hypothetical protein
MSAAELERMMKLRDVILKAMAKKTSWLEGAEMAGVTDRGSVAPRERGHGASSRELLPKLMGTPYCPFFNF